MTALYMALFMGAVGNPKEKPPRGVPIFPKMYALAKTGSVRMYQVEVIDLKDHAKLLTHKSVTMGGKVTTDTYEYWEGVNIGKSNETTYLEQAINEATSICKKLLDAGFTEGIPTGKYNTDAKGKIKPMLAISFNEGKIKFPCLCQTKFDGCRMTMSEENGKIHLLSRKGKEFNVPHLTKWALEHKDLLPLDGELYNHKDLSFQEIVSAVKRYSPITDKIRYAVYDRPVEGVPNLERWRKLIADFEPMTGDCPVYRSDWVYCDNIEQVRKYHDKCVANGYEGVIIRNFDGEYEFGFRSSNLIKLKEFNTDEFPISEVVEATGRDAGTGVFVLTTKDGGQFNAKPQGTRELRKEYFDNRESLVGKMVTVQYQGVSDEGIPRFPSAISIRDYE